MSAFQKIICGKLYDGVTPQLQENMVIVTEGDKIKEVGHNPPCPADAAVIDLSHLTVTPGMIDAHVHPAYFDWRDVYTDTVFNSDGYRCLAAATCASRMLAGGFTTMRAIGWFREDYILDVKRAINEGYVKGARVIAAPHLLGTTGSHGDMTQVVRGNPQVMDYMEHLYPGTGNGAQFFEAAVRREVKLGADFIKIMATGGFATPNDDPEDIQLSDAEFKAILDTAKALKKTVTAHAYGDTLIQKLIRFGIQGIEHGALMGKESAKMMEDSGTYLVPTFSPYEDSVHPDPESIAKKSAEFRRKLGIYQKQLQESRQIIIESKMTLGYGTDFVAVHNNYESGWEYRTWLTNGIDPFRALAAATKTNAEICGIADKVGTLEPGKLADVSGWGRDLLKDPDALRDCAFVMKEGAVYQAKSYIDL
jgi:imidazolonepropionase-like amidohydrolase